MGDNRGRRTTRGNIEENCGEYLLFKFENESDSKYNRYIMEEKNYASNKQAIERCKRLGDKARAEMDKYGSPDVNHNKEGGFVLNPG